MDYTGRIITKNQVVPTASSAPGIWTLDEAMQYTKQGKWPPGYQISRSVRLRSSASAYFNRTTGSPTSSFTFTHSFWVKRGALGASQALIAGARPTNFDRIYIQSNDTLLYQWNDGTSNLANIETTQVFRDPSAWYHFVFATDTTQATAANRVKIYVNGVQITALTSTTYPAQNSASYFNTGSVALNVGRSTNASMYFDGYLTEINFVDGQALTPASFGYTDTATGVWQPAPYNGTYGANGFYLNFKDPTSTTTIAYDYSGNSNNFTANNISVTSGSTYDSMVDVPINYGNDTGVGGEVRGSYCTGNPLWAHTSTITLSNGNLTAVWPGYWFGGTIGMSTGKWYWEFQITAGTVGAAIGIATIDRQQDQGLSNSTGGYAYGYINDGTKFVSVSSTPTTTSYGASYTTNDILGVAYDATNATITFYKNGSSQGTAFTSMTVATYLPAFGNTTGSSMTAQLNFGQRPFAYTAPSGYQALCTQNLPTPTISNGANYNASTLYTGNGGTLSVSNAVNGISFQPDLVWIKSRSAATNNKLTDSVRGATKAVISNTNGAETTDTNGLTAFGSSGFTVGTDTVYNNSGATYVGWNWKGGGTAVTNNDGNRTASVSANTTAGFSVVTYTFSTSATNTIGHGLGVAPSMLLSRNRTVANNWDVYHISLGYTQRLILNDTGAASGGGWAATPTSTVFSVTTGLYLNNDNIVTYCFAPITGYSAFGSYTGNGSTDGPFVYCGFRPRFVLVKDTVNITYWEIGDSSRNTYNAVDANLYPNSSFAEAADPMFDFLSNGFKVKKAGGNFNNSGAATIYAAFAENPFTIARAR